MVPRTQVEALPVTATLDDVRAAFLSSGYSRLPIYRDRHDDIVGLLFRKDVDMGRIPVEGFDLENLVRSPAFMPATASLGDALRLMQVSRIHFVFVVDEHGGMEGILTLEDLLEEIVGEINDEYDEEVREQIIRERGTYLLDGMLSVRDANKRLNLQLPDDNAYATIAGFLMAQAGRVLKPGDTVNHDSGSFTVERVDGMRISRVRFMPGVNTDAPSGKTISLLSPIVGASALAMHTAESLI